MTPVRVSSRRPRTAVNWLREIYLRRVMLPVLVCPSCGHEVLLPYRHFLASTTVESYWPDHGLRFRWVCDRCGRYTAGAADDFQWTSDPLYQGTDRGFWRVEISCGLPGCHSTVTVHTQTFGQTSRRNLCMMIALAVPTPTCEHGHPVSCDVLHAKSFDFVEWNGQAEYLV